MSDLLCNGATGTVLGIEESKNGAVTAVIVKFDNLAAGQESRRRNPMLSTKYPDGTIVKKKEQDYSLAKTQGLISSTAKLIQFPIVIAWTVTVYKFHGQTVRYPQKVVIDLRSVFEAAQAYVMLSRVQELEQMFILQDLPKDKIYANHKELTETERLLGVSMNMNPTYWEENDGSKTKVSFLNCRSIKNKFEHVKADMWLLQSDVIVLTETWLDKDDKDEFQLPNYNANLNNRGRGKGIASYYNNKFEHRKNINCNGFSITKIEAEDFVIIGIYKSKEGTY